MPVGNAPARNVLLTHRVGSNEGLQHMFSLRNKKKLPRDTAADMQISE